MTMLVALTIYDTLLTFKREIEYIWKQKLGAAAAIYFVNRYVYMALPFLEVLVANSLETDKVRLFSVSTDPC